MPQQTEASVFIFSTSTFQVAQSYQTATALSIHNRQHHNDSVQSTIMDPRI